MRRLIALLTALAVTFSLVSVPAHAAAVSARIRAVRILTPDSPTTKIEVEAYGIADITKVRAVVYAYLDGPPQRLGVDDFELVEGTALDGVWRTKSAVTVDQGRWWVDVELTTAQETHLWPQRVIIDNGLDTVIDDVEVTPTTVDVENPGIVFRGRLMSRTADGALSPVQGATLSLTGASAPIPTVVTGSDGRVEGTGDFPRTADAQLAYTGGFLYRPTKSAKIPVTKQRLDTRITLSVPDRLIVGDQVTATGRLERQDRNGVWAPLAGKQLRLSFDKTEGDGDWTVAGRPVTDANGVYRAPVTVTEPGAWSVSFANEPQTLPDDYYGYRMASAVTTNRTVVHRTSISGFNADPEPAALDGDVTVSGTVLWQTADGQWGPGGPADSVQLQFSTDGKTWKNMAVQVPGGEGEFRFVVPSGRDGYWRAVVPRGDYVEPSASGADYVDVKYRTHLYSFNASPEPVKKGATITVKGLLNRYMPESKPGPGANIHIYFKPAGSSTWTKMAITKTASNGWFKKTFTASKDGTWLARYWGSGTYIGSNAPSDYVDVR
ncbi:hypothetical protein [Actinomadura sp. BRA 177]|uniref:hypothetical protein n=1 Tax=Actinomadura sp. BRA 177 TaxID=2745202 RepID=UPI001595DDCA|nr:hypothetical protein [Actinomadura sp. BRA 177]NVI92537.1 hypothetical protein [Actinomadura sp. BRA 177]